MQIYCKRYMVCEYWPVVNGRRYHGYVGQGQSELTVCIRRAYRMQAHVCCCFRDCLGLGGIISQVHQLKLCTHKKVITSPFFGVHGRTRQEN